MTGEIIHIGIEFQRRFSHLKDHPAGLTFHRVARTVLCLIVTPSGHVLHAAATAVAFVVVDVNNRLATGVARIVVRECTQCLANRSEMGVF